MQNLIEFPAESHHPELRDLVQSYNQLNPQEQGLECVFLLQKINHYLETCHPDSSLQNWCMAVGVNSWEAHLQRYGISRDGSTLVKNIQFATAVRQHAPVAPPTHMDYFAALQERNALLSSTWSGITDDEMARYIQYNQIIINKYEQDPNLQDKFLRSRYFLSLCYAKMEAIKGVVDQGFEIFQTSPLGKQVNNKNFTLEVEGEEKQLVLRVEDRDSLLNEQVLQTFPVSDYFSEEYYTIMLPFRTGYLTTYRPVVLSEFVEQGALDAYAVTLQPLSPIEVTLEVQRIFNLLSDFCLKLMASDHYHPDIKLSNFLTDGQTIKVSDRKNITSKINPNGTEITSTVAFAPPEFQACLNNLKTAISPVKASKITMDMPKFMSYQMGMALKEFLLSTMIMKEITMDIFMEWTHISNLSQGTTRSQNNLFVLVQELTRARPNDRLSIENFQNLLNKIHLPHHVFLEEVEKVSPRLALSNHQVLAVIEAVLNTSVLSPELEQQWNQIEENNSDFLSLYADPRIRFFEKASQEIKEYLEAIDRLIAKENRNRTGSLRLIGNFMGLTVPETMTLEELPEIPEMSSKILHYFKIFAAIPTAFLEKEHMDKLKHIQMRQENLVHTSRSSLSEISSLTSSPDDTPRSSPLSHSEQQEVDVAEELHSGTFIRVPVSSPDSPTTDRDSLSITDYDSGTCVRVPTIPNAITTEEDTNFDTGSVVRITQKSPDSSPQDFKSRAAKIIAALNEADPAEERAKQSQRHSRKVSDIDTTIQRGNKL